jgi:hypothetical protein
MKITSLTSCLGNHRRDNREESEDCSENEEPDSACQIAESLEVGKDWKILARIEDAEESQESQRGD